MGARRTMRLLALIALVALAALAPAGPASAAKRCRFAGAHVVAKNRTARVYRFVDAREGISYFGGCLGRRGRSLFLDTDGAFEGVNTTSLRFVTLAGPYVALSFSFEGEGNNDAVVQLFSLRRESPLPKGPDPSGGHFRYLSPAVTLQPVIGPPTPDNQPPPPGGNSDVTALVLARTGTVAWIGRSRTDGHLEVHAFGAAQGGQLLDSGPDIDPATLTLSGGVLTWKRGGVPKSAPLA